MVLKTTITFEGALGLTRIDGAAMPGLKGNKTVSVVGHLDPKKVTTNDVSPLKIGEIEDYLGRLTGLYVRIETEAK